MRARSRFKSVSTSLSLGRLLKTAQRALLYGLAIATAVHLSTLLLVREGRTVASERPLTTRFVKRAPRLTKPLELKKRPQPKRRPLQRQMVSVKARPERRGRVSAFQPARALRGLARPAATVYSP